MKKAIFISLGLTVVLIVIIGLGIKIINKDQPQKNVTSEYEDINVKKIGNFTAITAEQLLAEKKNTCYSPIGVFSILCFSSQIMEEAAGREVLEALEYYNIDEMEKSYDSISEKIFGEIVKEDIRVANSIWFENENKFYDNEEIIISNKERFNTDVYYGDFSEEDINLWISEKTGGMINDVVENVEKFVIVNATYFSDCWLDKLYECGNEEFELASGDKVEVEFMEDFSRMKYVRGKDYIAVKKNYSGNSAMIFIQPDLDKEVSDLVKEHTINEILASFSNYSKEDFADVTLKLPKFQYNNKIDEKEIAGVLSSIGIKSFFFSDAWGKIVDESSTIGMFQDNRISVNEIGTGAASATVLKPYVQGSIGTDDEVIEIDITLNKPFMYIIVKDGIPLFIGTMYNPVE